MLDVWRAPNDHELQEIGSKHQARETRIGLDEVDARSTYTERYSRVIDERNVLPYLLPPLALISLSQVFGRNPCVNQYFLASEPLQSTETIHCTFERSDTNLKSARNIFISKCSNACSSKKYHSNSFLTWECVGSAMILIPEFEKRTE